MEQCKPGRLETEPLPVTSGWFRRDWPLSSGSYYERSCHSLFRGFSVGNAWAGRERKKKVTLMPHNRCFTLLKIKKVWAHLHTWGLVCKGPTASCRSGRRMWDSCSCKSWSDAACQSWSAPSGTTHIHTIVNKRNFICAQLVTVWFPSLLRRGATWR